MIVPVSFFKLFASVASAWSWTDLFYHLQIEIFPYSVFYMFFEQYLNIWRTALINLAIAIGQ